MLYFTHENGFARIAVRGELNSALHRDLAETLDVLTLAYCYERVELIVDSPGGELDALFDSIDTLAEVRSRGVRIDTHVPRRVSSAAAFLAALGDRRSAGARAIYHMHGTQVTPSRPGGLCAGDVYRLRAEVQGLDARLVALLVQRVSQVAVPRPLPSRLARSLDRDVLCSLVPARLLPNALRARYEEGDDAERLAVLAGLLWRGLEMTLAGEAPEPECVDESVDFGPAGVTLLHHWIATLLACASTISAQLALVLGLVDHVVEPDEEQAGLALARVLPYPPAVRVPSWQVLYRDGQIPLRALERGALVVGDANSGAFEHGLAPLVCGLGADRSGAVRAMLALDSHGRLGSLLAEAASGNMCEIGASAPIGLFGSAQLDALLEMRAAGRTLRVASQLVARAEALRGDSLDDASRDLVCAAFALLLEPEVLDSSQWACGVAPEHAVLERLRALADDGRWSLLALTDWLLRGALFDLPAGTLLVPGFDDVEPSVWTPPDGDEAQSGGLCVLARLFRERFACFRGDVRRALEHLSRWCTLASSNPDRAAVPLRAALAFLAPFAAPCARLALCSGLEAHRGADPFEFGAPSSSDDSLHVPRVVVLGPQACACGLLARTARLRFAEDLARIDAPRSDSPPLCVLVVDDAGVLETLALQGARSDSLHTQAREAGLIEVVAARSARAACDVLDLEGRACLTLVFRTADAYTRALVRAASRGAGGGLPDVETVRPTVALRYGECYAALPGEVMVRRLLAREPRP